LSKYFAPSEDLCRQSDKSADNFEPAELQLVEAYIHEISNQITVILGISELALEARPRNRTAPKPMEQIVKAARRAAHATHKLLELKVKHLPAAAYLPPDKEKQPAILP